MPISFEMEQVQDTLLHINIVARYLLKASNILGQRAIRHDNTKFDQGEWEYFVAHTAKLSELTYGSPEYKAELDAMRPAIEKHYAANRHHPEHFPEGTAGMTLIDLLEMLCDWLAATQRHRDGDIVNSIKLNQQRFGYSDELKSIFLRTIYVLKEQ